MKLQPPVAYQGGKQRIAGNILDEIKPRPLDLFHDLCCGSGAISIELVNRGHDPDLIHMLDAGPWGCVWQAIGAGSFDLDRFAQLCHEIPTDRDKIQSHIKTLSQQPANVDTAYVFLILQASSFGGKAIWIENDRWHHHSFRSYWQPTATSSRRSPVNPMMPMPDTLIERMTALATGLRGVHGHWQDIREYQPGSGVVYIDPPYVGTTDYGHDFNLHDYLNFIKQPTFVSEGFPFFADSIRVSGGRAKGGISGERKSANQEWLSHFGVAV